MSGHVATQDPGGMALSPPPVPSDPGGYRGPGGHLATASLGRLSAGNTHNYV